MEQDESAWVILSLLLILGKVDMASIEHFYFVIFRSVWKKTKPEEQAIMQT